ncbi:MAG: hypothetical protein IJW25_00835 [Clostridia bacterium]|nr:hypothetical protein [Clostridia bacterium]
MQEIINKIKSLFKTPMLLVFVIICFTLLPNAINMQSAVFRSAIVVAFGIDKDQSQNYVINAAVNVSSTAESLSENTKLISAKGKSVSDAISNLSIQFGRPIRLGHTRFVLIGTALAKENVAVALDGIIRTNKMRDTVQLVLCDAPVDDMLNVGIEIKNKTGIKMSEIMTYQSKYSTTAMDSNVDTFYKGYFSNAGISKLNCIRLTDDFTQGITPDAALGEIGGKSGGEESQDAGGAAAEQEETKGSSKQTKKYLSVLGDIAVFKNGVLKTIVPPNTAIGANWINASHIPQKLDVAVEGGILEKAHLYFYVLNKTVSREVFIYNDIPMMSVKINLTLGIDEIINQNSQITPLSQDVIDQDVKCAIGRELRRQTGEALLYSKQTGLDILELNEIFYLSKYKQYQNYLQNGHTTEDLINNAQISLEVRVEVI